MKRHGNLFDKIVTQDNLYQSYLDARKNKRGKGGCLSFERRIGSEMHDLEGSLKAGTYRPRPYWKFEVREPKPRLIYAPAFRDRVVQHAVYRVLRPILDKRFIGQSFACRPGYGTHGAADYLQNALRKAPRNSYTLKMDVRRFYYSIDRTILRGMLERIIKCRRTISLVMLFTNTGEPKGLPIGNLLSQILALLYLNKLDHFIKRELKVEWYCRYVDDMALVGIPTRKEANRLRLLITEFMRAKLDLGVSRYTIASVQRGMNFVGYRTWAGKRFIRRHALGTFRKNLKRGLMDRVVSSLGHAKHTASLKRMIEEVRLTTGDCYAYA